MLLFLLLLLLLFLINFVVQNFPVKKVLICTLEILGSGLGLKDQLF
jgi:hypothetical protein